MKAAEFADRRAFVAPMKKVLRLVWDQIIPPYECSAAPVHHNVPADSHQVTEIESLTMVPRQGPRMKLQSIAPLTKIQLPGILMENYHLPALTKIQLLMPRPKTYTK